MKKIFLLICIGLNLGKLSAQEGGIQNDFGRISLNPYISEQAKLPAEAKAQLEIKLQQIATNYGLAGSSFNPRFILTANISITTKDIIAGPPQLISQNMDITLFIGDGMENQIYSNTVITTKGVGSNENKAFIDAIKQVKTKSKEIEKFIEDGKMKIIAYYNNQCDLITKKAESLKGQEKFSEAIFTLALVPEVCKDCYLKCLNEMAVIYNLKINADGKSILHEAKAIWSANPNSQGAQGATNLIMQIKPQAESFSEAGELLKSISEKVLTDEKERLRKQDEYEKRQQEFNQENTKQEAELEKIRVNTYRDIAIEYMKNQPTVVYRNVYWR